MVLPRVILTDLRELAHSIDADDDTLADALARLVTHLRRTAPSYTGLQLTVGNNGTPVTLTHYAAASEPPTTSLRVASAAVFPHSDGASRVVFYAARLGAFVDLAADLSYVLGVGIELDGDLAPVSPQSGMVGLAELSTINRAIGFLIGQGHSPEHAHEILRRGAAGVAVDLHVFAATLLGR